MISWQEFIKAIEKGLGKHRTSDSDQMKAVRQSKDKNVVIYAGPGTGKTAALTLRIIKLVLVDGVLPQHIMATTFTRKAAKELRSRLIEWSEAITSNLRGIISPPDWDLVMVDTLDSLAEQLLSDVRAPGQPKKVIIPERAARQVWANILFDGYPHVHQDGHVVALANSIGLGSKANFRSSLQALSLFRERAHQDFSSLDKFFKKKKKYENAKPLIDRYENILQENLWLDFAGLENEFLRRLKDPNDLSELKAGLQAVLVDEYQDTNRLQEQIYFELAKAVSKNNGGITVVGDDDQSLYRFRGSKVELFSRFQDRMHKAIKQAQIEIVTLRSNYRSTANIVAIANHFIGLDKSYQTARATFKQGGSLKSKPPIVKKRPLKQDEFPILFMLRENRVDLAADLGSLISQAFQGPGYSFECNSHRFTIKQNPDKGSVSDAALLCASPREKMGADHEEKSSLPLLLRRNLEGLQRPIKVFNPRGRDLATFEPVAQLMGLALCCVDPERSAQAEVSHSRANHETLDEWRATARSFISSAPPSQKGEKLSKFVKSWPQSFNYQASITELVHELVAWIPYFQDDPEGLALLEQIMRIVTEAAVISRYSMNVLNHRDHKVSLASRKEAVRHFFFAVVDDAGEMDEDILFAPPRDCFPIMSIHQAKGLEFPLTIVDVGARFKMNHSRQRMFRFPEIGSTSHLIEELLDGSVGGRDAVQRAFDDLVRLYFVSFTRACDVLILAGLNKNFTSNTICNVALGWDRDGTWQWEHLAESFKGGNTFSNLSYGKNKIPISFI